MKHSRRRWLRVVTHSVTALALGAGLTSLACSRKEPRPAEAKLEGTANQAEPAAAPPIRIGILHSLSGTMAISETILKDFMLMQVAELNEKGGLLGRKIEPVTSARTTRPSAIRTGRPRWRRSRASARPASARP